MQLGNSQVPYRCFARTIMRWDAVQKKLRVARICWARHGGPAVRTTIDDSKPLFPIGYTASLSLVITTRRLVGWSRAYREWHLTICGVQVHYQIDYGGWKV